MGALTPVLLVRAPGQVSLVHELALSIIPSPTPPCAPLPDFASVPEGLRLRFAFWAIRGSSDFVQFPQSHQSHVAVSSSCCRPCWPGSLRTNRSLSVALHLILRSRSHFRFSWWEAPPGRVFHPLAHVHSQAHGRRPPRRLISSG